MGCYVVIGKERGVDSLGMKLSLFFFPFSLLSKTYVGCVRWPLPVGFKDVIQTKQGT